MSEHIDHLKLQVGRTVRRITALLDDFDSLQDDVGRTLPSIQRASEAEKLEITAGLLGFDAELPDRLRRTALSLAELLALLDHADEAEEWLRRRLKELNP
jgi:hypothetical protein